MRSQKILNQEEAERLALDALGFLAADEDRLFRFLDATGLRPETLREAAGAPDFLTAVLDYVVSDEPLMLHLAAALTIKPERIMEAKQKLSPSAPMD